MSNNTSDLNEFEKQLKGELEPVQPQPTEKKQTIQKNLITAFGGDMGGCYQIRIKQPSDFISSVYKTRINMIALHRFLRQDDILAKSFSLVFQRQSDPNGLHFIKHYKRLQDTFQYKMIWDIDDLLWKRKDVNELNGVPKYNLGYPNITKEVQDITTEIMGLMDRVVTSTEYLKQFLQKEVGVKTEIKVMRNSVPNYLWHEFRDKKIKSKIKKPVICYTGSPTHYSNKQKLKGDFDNVWCEWIRKNIMEDKIEFHVFGGCPWFFEDIRNKINVQNFMSIYLYPNAVKETMSHFGIAPLVPNEFNYCKSNIKMIEYYNAKILGIGTTFSNGKPSPYDDSLVSLPDNCTEKDIDELFDKYTEPECYNSTIDKQLQYLSDGHYITEDPQFVKDYLLTYTGGNNVKQ